MLDARFHPGGAKGPKEEWFEMPLEGPSIPTGTFVWLSHYRYLVIPRNILKALSFGLLVPKEATTKVRLKPGFCPEFDYGSKRIGVQYPKRFLFREEKEKLFTKIDSNKNGVLDPVRLLCPYFFVGACCRNYYHVQMRLCLTDNCMLISFHTYTRKVKLALCI